MSRADTTSQLMFTNTANRIDETSSQTGEVAALPDLEGATIRLRQQPYAAASRAAEKRDLYQLVTDRIIEQLENGVAPWASPLSKRGLPKNLVSGKEYRGVNPFVLWSAPCDSRYWLTFKQAQALGGNVRRGEKGTPVVYWHWRTPEEMAKLTEKTPDPAPCYPFYATIFNLEQCEGIAAPADDTQTFAHTPLEEAERVIKDMPQAPQIAYTHNDKPAYRPATDTVAVPTARRFTTAEGYYCTMFHELGHATGHESRLNRQNSQKHRFFGSPDYSFEELVAELTAAFLCAHCGIANQLEQSASYIEGWLSVFRQDKKILLEAASAAQRAADFILNMSFAEETAEHTG